MDDTTAARSGQQQFDFYERDRIVASLCLPKSVTVSDRSVGCGAIKSVLFRLLHHADANGESFPGITTLSQATGLGVNTVRRALEALRILGLITIVLKRSARSRVVCNHYTILWDEVRSRCAYGGHPEVSSERSPTSGQSLVKAIAHQAPTDRPQSATDRPQSATDRPPGTDRSPTVGTELSMERMDEQPKNSIQGRHGVSGKSGGAGKGTLEPLQSGLKTSDLADALRVDQLWKIAARRGLLPQTAYWRLTFFGLCWSLYRRRHKLLNPVGLLHRKLADGRQAVLDQVDDETDRAWARKIIAELDGIQPATPARSSADPRALEIQEFEQRRDEQLRRLNEAFPVK